MYSAPTMHRYFFYALILLLPTQLGYHFWPTWAYVFGRRIDYLSPTLFLTDILIFFTVVPWVVHQIMYRLMRNPKRQIPNFKQININNYQIIKKEHAYVAIIIVFAGLNIFFAVNHFVAVYAWIKVAEFIFLGWYIVKTKPSIAVITTFFSIGVFYASALAIAQFFLQHSAGGMMWFLGERTFTIDTPGIARFHFCQPFTESCQLLLRPYAAFPHPNVLGGFLAAVLPLVIFNFQFSCLAGRQAISNQTKKFRIFNIMTIVLGMIALVFTFSRSAWMGIGLGFGIAYFVISKKKKTVLIQKTFAPLFILLSTAFLVLFVTFRPAGSDESVIVRNDLQNAAVKIWKSAPWFGSGLSNFLVRLPEVLVSRQIYFLQPVHNIYLLLLSETGIVGIGVLLFLVFSFLKNKPFLSNTAFFIPSLAAIIVIGFMDHYFLTLQQGQLLLTIFLALLMAHNRNSNERALPK